MSNKMNKQLKKERERKAKKKEQMLKVLYVIITVLVIAALIAIVAVKNAGQKSSVNVDYKVTHYADIVIKDYGTITVELYGKLAPITVENFVSLAESGFYDGLTFHRIMSGFMMQGGDPAGNGSGGAANEIKGEFAANGVANDLSHKRGVISMARSKAYDSASSQFFIMHGDSTHLDGSYAAFGCVISGIEVVDEVCATAQPIDNNGTIPAAQQPVIESITIRK